LGSELADDRPQAVVAAWPAALPEAQLAEREREVVDHHEQLAERSPLPREHLSYGEAGLIHPGLRLDQQQVEPVKAPLDERGRVAAPTTAGPPGPIGQAVEDQPADVVAGLPVLLAGIAQPDDDLVDHGPPKAL